MTKTLSTMSHMIVPWDGLDEEAAQHYADALASNAVAMHDALKSFPDMQDGRSSPKELREAASNWYWETVFPILKKIKE